MEKIHTDYKLFKMCKLWRVALINVSLGVSLNLKAKFYIKIYIYIFDILT